MAPTLGGARLGGPDNRATRVFGHSCQTVGVLGPRARPYYAAMAEHDGADDAGTPPTPWLDHDQQQVWRDWLQAGAVVDRYLDADLRSQGLGLGEYEILVHLSEAPDQRLRMGALAELAHHSRSRLTHTVARMESRGLVERISASHDRRGVIAHLTADGHALVVQTAPQHLRAVRKAFIDAIDPEDLVVVGRALRAVLRAVRD